MTTKTARYELTINIPVTADIKYVDVWPDNGYGAQVSLKATIDGQTQAIYLKGKAWANLKALQNGGVIGDYDQSIEEPTEKANVPVVNGKGVTLTMRKLAGEKYANLVVERAGQSVPTATPPSFTSPNAPPGFLAEQTAHETQAVRTIQQGSVNKLQAVFSLYDVCLDHAAEVAAHAKLPAECVPAMAATLFIAAKDRGLAA